MNKRDASIVADLVHKARLGGIDRNTDGIDFAFNAECFLKALLLKEVCDESIAAAEYLDDRLKKRHKTFSRLLREVKKG